MSKQSRKECFSVPLSDAESWKALVPFLNFSSIIWTSSITTTQKCCLSRAAAAGCVLLAPTAARRNVKKGKEFHLIMAKEHIMNQQPKKEEKIFWNSIRKKE